MRTLPDALVPLLHLLPPERAHRLTIRALALSAKLPRRQRAEPASLGIRLWGRDFANPVGLAAGFDKHCEAPGALLGLGFGAVEIGTVTPLPQPGNSGTRIFRLDEDKAVINRLGFNSDGIDAVTRRLAAFRRRGAGMVGVNIGKNRDAADATADYVRGIVAFAPLADYLVVNISSPNTPGLRDMQRKAVLGGLLAELRAARDAVMPENPPPLLLKIAPDLTSDEVEDIAEAALEARIDGLIVANTTVARPASLRSRHAQAEGGLSGKPLSAVSTALLAELYRLTEGALPIIGVGGISSGAEAYAKICAGASLVQIYSAFIFEGPGLVTRIKEELAALLARDGFASVAAAVGSAVTLPGARQAAQ